MKIQESELLFVCFQKHVKRFYGQIEHKPDLTRSIFCSASKHNKTSDSQYLQTLFPLDKQSDLQARTDSATIEKRPHTKKIQISRWQISFKSKSFPPSLNLFCNLNVLFMEASYHNKAANSPSYIVYLAADLFQGRFVSYFCPRSFFSPPFSLLIQLISFHIIAGLTSLKLSPSLPAYLFHVKSCRVIKRPLQPFLGLSFLREGGLAKVHLAVTHL